MEPVAQTHRVEGAYLKGRWQGSSLPWNHRAPSGRSKVAQTREFPWGHLRRERSHSQACE